MVSKGITDYCKDFERIENYEEAVNDTTQTWICHHRMETHNTDGTLRDTPLSRAELIAMNMYFDQPASAFVFLRKSDHSKMHQGLALLQQVSFYKPSKPFEVSVKKPETVEESRIRVRERMKIYWASEENRKARSEAQKGKHSKPHKPHKQSWTQEELEDAKKLSFKEWKEKYNKSNTTYYKLKKM